MRLHVLALLLCGCEIDARIQAGSGVIVEATAERTEVALDGTRIPVVEGCAPGLVLRRTAEGFTCGPIDPSGISSARLDELTTRAVQLEGLVQALDRRLGSATASVAAIESLRDALEAAATNKAETDAARSFGVAAITCAREPEEWQQGIFRENAGMIENVPVGFADAHLYCPFFALDAATSLNAFEIAYRAREAPSSGVRAALLLFDVFARRIQIAFGSAAWHLVQGFARTGSNIYNYRAIRDEPGHIDAALESGGELPVAALIGFRVYDRGPAKPPELQAAGGVLYLDAGSDRERENNGVIWFPDGLFLAPDHVQPGVAETTRPVDRSRITAEAPPFLFNKDATCDCNLRYQLDVPPGRYSVTTIFAETCFTCTTIDGNGLIDDRDPKHVVRIRVEDQSQRFVPADAAIPPADDNIGEFDIASAFSTEVSLSEGLLDIVIEQDRGPAVLSGLIVRRLE